MVNNASCRAVTIDSENLLISCLEMRFTLQYVELEELLKLNLSA